MSLLATGLGRHHQDLLTFQQWPFLELTEKTGSWSSLLLCCGHQQGYLGSSASLPVTSLVPMLVWTLAWQFMAEHFQKVWASSLSWQGTKFNASTSEACPLRTCDESWYDVRFIAVQFQQRKLMDLGARRCPHFALCQSWSIVARVEEVIGSHWCSKLSLNRLRQRLARICAWYYQVRYGRTCLGWATFCPGVIFASYIYFGTIAASYILSPLRVGLACFRAWAGSDWLKRGSSFRGSKHFYIADTRITNKQKQQQLLWKTKRGSMNMSC